MPIEQHTMAFQDILGLVAQYGGVTPWVPRVAVYTDAEHRRRSEQWIRLEVYDPEETDHRVTMVCRERAVEYLPTMVSHAMGTLFRDQIRLRDRHAIMFLVGTVFRILRKVRPNDVLQLESGVPMDPANTLRPFTKLMAQLQEAGETTDPTFQREQYDAFIASSVALLGTTDAWEWLEDADSALSAAWDGLAVHLVGSPDANHARWALRRLSTRQGVSPKRP